MCLLCEELWMPFELPPEAKPRTFVADSPEPDDAGDAPGDARTAGFPSPHSRSEWRGGVRGGGPLSSPSAPDQINEDIQPSSRGATIFTSEPASPPTPDPSPPRFARGEGNPDSGAPTKNERR
jgi:hypothetical protein